MFKLPTPTNSITSKLQPGGVLVDYAASSQTLQGAALHSLVCPSLIARGT